MTEKDIVRINSIRPGWKDVRNVAQMRYGSQYYIEANSTTAGESFPTSQDIYGDAILSDDYNEFLLANNADVATGAVQQAQSENALPRLCVQLVRNLMPHVELADICQITFSDDPLKTDNVLGDMLQTFGGSGPFGEAGSGILLRDKQFKVVGLTHRFADEETDLTLLEVL
jgi:hypothetical protein